VRVARAQLRTAGSRSPSIASISAKRRLGGYLARANDPPPGNTVMWRGRSRLMDIKLGAEIATTCG
jgi:hypothetical protein